MSNHHLYKAKRRENGEWTEGSLLRLTSGKAGGKDGCMYYIIPEITEESLSMQGTELKFFSPCYEVDVSTVCKSTGKKYMDQEAAYQGDIFESQVNGILMILRYGTYQAYCPVDRAYMDSVGFYAECKGLPDMPIGDLNSYALKRGNIFDNPDLIGGSTDEEQKKSSASNLYCVSEYHGRVYQP